MKVITVIPARSGSKSIPKKNIQLLDGKPLLSYSIKYSLSSNLVSNTIVSTDCSSIAEIATQNGASVPFLRPAHYAEDNSQDYQFMRHALDFFEGKGQIFDVYILLRPTSPLRPSGLIEQALEILENNAGATSVRSMTKIKEHPYRVWRQNDDKSVCGFIESEVEPYNIPRQELPTLFFQTGDIEVVRRETIINGSISGDRVYPLIIKHEDMIDIDSQSDFDRAEKSNADR
tara:strand:- start:2966 stop:3658 length:693 start_codon:yes stop_codon:yes gene_type:complete